MKYDIITIGGAVLDQFLYTKEGMLVDNKKDPLAKKLLGFEYGAKVSIDKAETAYGGGAANAAVACARLGLKTACVAAIGKDATGEGIRKNFKSNKVDCGLLQIEKNEPTGFSCVIVGSDSEHVAFPFRGANENLQINKAVKKVLRKTEWIYLTSLSGNWKATLTEIFNNKTKAKIAWNPGHEQLKAGIRFLKPYLELTDILIVNHDEALELLATVTKFKKGAKLPEQSEKLCELLHSLGSEIVVVTDGDKGAKVYNGEDFFTYKPKTIRKVVNTIGVGDAFGSSFVAGLKIYKNAEKALELAGLNSRQVVLGHGAQSNLLFKKQIYV